VKGFRTRFLWTSPINELLQTNEVELRQLFETHLSDTKQFLSLEDCNALFHTKTGLLTNAEQIKFCFGMSK